VFVPGDIYKRFMTLKRGVLYKFLIPLIMKYQASVKILPMEYTLAYFSSEHKMFKTLKLIGYVMKKITSVTLRKNKLQLVMALLTVLD
jgi:hypothetical protein